MQNEHEQTIEELRRKILEKDREIAEVEARNTELERSIWTLEGEINNMKRVLDTISLHNQTPNPPPQPPRKQVAELAEAVVTGNLNKINDILHPGWDRNANCAGGS